MNSKENVWIVVLGGWLLVCGNVLVACGDDDIENLPDTGDHADLVDEQSQEDLLDIGEQEPDEEVAEETTEEPLCLDFSGAYEMTGACSNALLSFYDFACVRQTSACDLSFFVTSAAFEGQVDGRTFEVESVYNIAPATCTGSQESEGDPVEIECAVPAYSVTCSGQATPMAPIADASSACCDALAQDCGEGERCTFVDGGVAPLVSACLSQQGSVAEGESCQRFASGLEGVGRDDCAPGLMCANYGSATFEERTCLAFCSQDADCDEGLGCCAGLYNVPRTGLCTASCDPFGSAEECVEGAVCAMLHGMNRDDSFFLVSGFCMPGGTAEEDEACNYNQDCQTGQVCSQVSNRCRHLCDDDHPCTLEGQSCSSAFGLNFRFCEAN